jgi:hypothetical protein
LTADVTKPIPDLPPRAIEELKRGRKLNAIKIVREQCGLDLKASKDAVDSFAKARPELMGSEWKESRTPWDKGLSWSVKLLLAACIAYLVVFWLSHR